jgi:putative tryptophan/tyrosine transport system substrate-binding protein
MAHFRRREFIIGMIGGTASWPLVARGQQSPIPVVCLLHTGSALGNAESLAGFRQGFSEAGFIEGQSIAIEYHWADGHYERLPAMASDLARRRIAVVVAGGTTAPAEAFKAASSTIPIVFVTGDDPARSGLVASFNRPGGNVTGVYFFNGLLSSKRVEILHELLPTATSLAYVMNPGRLEADAERSAVQDAARSFGVKVHVLPASSERDIDAAFESLRQLQISAVLMAADPFLGSRRPQLAELARRHAMPLIGTSRDYVVAGSLASYGTSIRDAYRQAALYVSRILNGTKPADLPVLQPTKFELAINLKVARALGLTVPATLLARADEVIE